jgi:hypothetical protein
LNGKLHTLAQLVVALDQTHPASHQGSSRHVELAQDSLPLIEHLLLVVEACGEVSKQVGAM